MKENGTKSGTESRHFIQVLERSLDLLSVFGAESPEMTLSEIGARTHLDRATVRRIVLTLVDLGYAEKHGKLFRLAPRVLQIGYRYLASLGIAQRAQYVLETLAAETNQSASLGVLDGQDVVYVARASVPGLAMLATPIGTRIPAYPLSMGRVLLASLEPDRFNAYLHEAVLHPFTAQTVTQKSDLRRIVKTVRDQGYAYVAGEHDPAAAGVSVPVVKPNGRVIAAMSLSTPRIGKETLLGEYLPKLRNAAKLLSEG